MYSVKKNPSSSYGKDVLPTIEAIQRSGGTFIGVTYITKNGEVRNFNGRIGVKKHLKTHQGNPYNNKYITIYDVKLGGYRTLLREGIREIRANGMRMSYRSHRWC